ncbi:lactose transport system permease protein LacF [bacterium BMS3Abin02]|nr:lactose transport system permease protein LacF [bacterium BMS3Abin02]GBE21893.1 lactose transport system permease protein LacF [bacterium BMS3Bbin01]
MSVEMKPEASVAERAARSVWVGVLRLVASLGVPIVAFILLWLTFQFLRKSDAPKLVLALVAIIVGVGGIFLLFWAMDFAVSRFSDRVQERVRPYVFVGPALVILSVFLVYPAINTTILSFKDATSSTFVGLDNYKFVFSDPAMLRSIRNTFGWVIAIPLFTVGVGLGFATLVDRLHRGEAVAKSLIFLPMAVSFVGASIVWRFVYSFRPEGFGNQIGLLNGIMVSAGKQPIPWLQEQPWNNLLLMVVMVWLQTGFAMVILSAGIKAVPDEILEAARIDGAREFQVFWRVIVPSIMSTIVVVTTTMFINAMKIFDIIWVMTNGQNGTEVIAERMLRWFFKFGDNGKGAAIAVVLFVAVIPIMVLNVKRFKAEEAIR